jgi:hypothetical protein
LAQTSCGIGLLSGQEQENQFTLESKGAGAEKRADNRLAPEERLEEIDAKQDEFEEGESQPECSGN